MILLNEFYLMPDMIASWIARFDTFDYVFWICLFAGFFCVIIGYNLSVISTKSNAEPIYFSTFKKNWNNNTPFNIFHFFIGIGAYGFFGLLFKELSLSVNPITPAIIGGFMSIILSVLITYYLFNRRFSPAVIIAYAETTTAYVVDIIPKNETGTGEMSVAYQEFKFIFKCSTTDSEDIKHGATVKILHLEDNNETFMVTKYI